MDLPIALVGLVAGAAHVLVGPDHLAAVAPLAVDPERDADRPARRAGWAGLTWGLGHSLGVTAIGLLALLLRDRLPLEALSYWSERAVGFVLIGIGVWVFLQLAGRARPMHGDRVRHGHAALSIGVLHGFAGSSHLLGVLPALALPSMAAGAIWLGSFALGTVLAMAGFTASLGSLAGRMRGAGTRLLLGGSATAAVATGLWWLLRPLAPAV